ncbi:MAG: amino acid adenylation domain-containing protein, partial [Bacteroidota bacterium]
FQVLFVLLNIPDAPKLKLGELHLTGESHDHSRALFDLTFFVNEKSDKIAISINYRNDLFAKETIQRMNQHLKTLLESIAANPMEKVNQLSILSLEEESNLKAEAKLRTLNLPEGASIVSAFEVQARQSANEIAITSEGRAYTYAELNGMANKLAQLLQTDYAVKPNDLVGIMMENSEWFLVSIIAILKAGAGYVPIDIDLPQDRKAFMIQDTGVKTLLIEFDSLFEVTEFAVKVCSVDMQANLSGPEEEYDNLANDIHTDSTAYIIYTSGSTGKPKGVAVTHHNIIDYTYGLFDATKIADCRSFGLMSTLAADLGNTMLFGALLSGGTLHIFTKDTLKNANQLHQYFADHEVDCIKIVPSHWRALEKERDVLLPTKMIVFGGEVLSTDILAKIKQTNKDLLVINHYGPTETTIGKLLHRVDLDQTYASVPIGKPFSNTKIYVVDEALGLCPTGVPGELLIGGEGVSKGYLNRPDLSTEKFVAHPFDKASDAKFYRTGDLVRRLPNGEIDFLGRIDDQVKIRGYRVELQEIEKVIRQSDLVSDCTILTRKDHSDTMNVVAYIVPQDQFNRTAIQEYATKALPDYMIPAFWIEMTEIPLTKNGKVNRHLLPSVDTAQINTGSFQEAATQTEKALVDIWKQILELEKVSTTANFFELGGHSLLAIRVISSIKSDLEKELKVGDIFDYPTIQTLGEFIDTQQHQVLLPPILPAERPDRIPLSYAQERLWFIDQFEGSVQYHQPSVMRLENNLDQDLLEVAIRDLIHRHEALRTVIRSAEGLAYQEVRSAENWKLGYSKLNAEQESTLPSLIKNIILKPFDLSHDYMMRAHLVENERGEFTLILVLHHIASDGWSNGIIMNDLTEIYNAKVAARLPDLPPIPVQYADYAIWQREHMSAQYLASKLAWWENQLSGTTPMDLPTDFPRPPVQSTKGAAINFSISKALLDQLKAVSLASETTLFMTLLAAFKILLYKYSGQQDICVGTPVANRHQTSIEGTVGFFINTLALRSNLANNPTFKSLLTQIKETTLSAFANQEVPFEQIVNKVELERNLSRSPIYQVMFLLQNTPESVEVELQDTKASNALIPFIEAQYELTFNVKETSNSLEVGIIYCSDLFQAETIKGMGAHFQLLLEQVALNPEQSIDHIAILPAEERTQLLQAFNDTNFAYPKDQTLVHLFTEQAALRPDHIALKFGEEVLTYADLHIRSNQLAHYLHRRGVTKDTLVALLMDRSSEMIITMLGVMKAGAAYIPIDTGNPMERIEYVLADTQTKYLICTPTQGERVKGLANTEILDWNELDQFIAREQTTVPLVEVNPKDLAYVIYTSGSTGQPKGVMIEHQALLNFLCSMKNQLQIDSDINLLAVTTYSFDIAGLEIYLPLLSGGKITLCSHADSWDGLALQKLIKEQQVSHLQATPATWQILLQSGWKNEEHIVIMSGGEAIKEQLKNKLLVLGSKEVWNLYGPTETTIWSTCKRLVATEKVNVGKPIGNTQIYILDTSDDHSPNLLPRGVVGELCIAGDGLARGYWNRPDLTAEKFIQNPFSNHPSDRIYRTGDLARWLPNGEIECLGRLNDQVKIRGYRIELGEIENQLSSSDLVKQCAVVAVPDHQDNLQLVAYVIWNGANESVYDAGLLQDYLKKKLPSYMIPAIWVEEINLPLNQAGKVDKKALLQRKVVAATDQVFIAPTTRLEKAIAEIWQTVLGLDRVGVADNFF